LRFLVRDTLSGGRSDGSALPARVCAAPSERRGGVSIAFSFQDRTGAIGRTFAPDAGSIAGLACRSETGWRVELLAPRPGTAGSDGYAQAASSLPASVLSAVDARITGDAFDVDAERRAREARSRRR
jgi:hypothetical protein